VAPTQANAKETVPAGSTERWTDKKRYLWLLGLVIPTLGVAVLLAYLLLGWAWTLWVGPILILGIVPAIDLVAGLDRSNPPDDVIEALEQDRYYRWITYLYLPLQYLSLVVAVALIGGVNPIARVTDLLGLSTGIRDSHLGTLLLADPHLGIVDKVALAISVGCIGGIGINTAHELGHKKEKHERWLSKVALMQSCYGHFYIEHNRGHHVRVATPEDPASSRLGESFYQFWPRTVVGSLRSAWRLERKRYGRRNRHPYRIGNDVISSWLMSTGLFAVLCAVFGVGVLPYLVLQAVVGFSLLEVINYMEHYGMRRQKVGLGERQRYERVNPSHSWNSNNVATNVLLYHLQRHSDHHANPTRRYQALRDFKESPVLPTGYAGMIVLAIVPALWRRVMDPRVVAHFDGDVTLANISPRKREQILAKWTRPVASDADPAMSYAAPYAAPYAALSGEPGNAAYEILSARCPGCGYTYRVEEGNEREGFAAGTAWDQVPDDWCCPDCGVREKVDFVAAEAS